MASLNSDTRTTVAEVREIIDLDTSVVSDAQLKQFINMAADIVNDVDARGDLDANRLKLIEMNVAAHFASAKDPRAYREDVADAEFSYQGPRDVTEYWRTAVMLDSTNTLSLETSATASISVLDSRNIS